MDMSMDIHGKSVDMDMDEKFYIHGKPGYLRWLFTTVAVYIAWRDDHV